VTILSGTAESIDDGNLQLGWSLKHAIMCRLVDDMFGVLRESNAPHGGAPVHRRISSNQHDVAADDE